MQYPTFLFFSETEALVFSETSRRLLTWAGEKFPLPCFTLARECITRIETPEHKITLEDAEDLIAMLGTCCLTSNHAEPTRTLWRDCVRILSKKINDIPAM